jgi:hypothetical protein
MRNRSARRFRRTARHVVGARGQAVALDGFRLIGERILDASAEGVLLACDDRVAVGDAVMVSFPVPDSELWFDAEAEVVRVLRGEREGDPGYCAGLRFVGFDRGDRLALGVDLRALPLVPRQVRWGTTQTSVAVRAARTVA